MSSRQIRLLTSSDADLAAKHSILAFDEPNSTFEKFKYYHNLWDPKYKKSSFLVEVDGIPVAVGTYAEWIWWYEPGRYELRFTPLFADGTPVGESLSLGELQINNIGREYELPEPVAVPIEASFSALTLHGMDSAELATRPGEAPEVTLYWENDADHGQVYSIFVHLLDESGNIVLQADHWPGGLPTDILDSGQIVTDRFSLPLPEDLPPGDYRVRIGVYSAESGQRLPVTATGALPAELIGPDYVILPVALRVVAP